MNTTQFDSIVSLLKKRLQGPLTTEETVQLEQWLAEAEENRSMLQKLDDPAVIAREMQLITGAGESIYAKIQEQIPELAGPVADEAAPRIPFLRRGFMRYAAAAVVVLGIGTYIWLNRSEGPTPHQVVSATTDSTITPGRSGAILTLADGSQVVLDSLNNGSLAQQNGSEVIMQDGRLVYDPAAAGKTEVLYNTMTTPRGRQFEITLPDGSHVWLNAASSIRYPTAFTGTIRKVELDGEAYFEVVKNAKQPFIVDARKKSEIEVLGTSFNVSAYKNDRSLNTTLIDGSVKVNGTVIRPGQQAQVTDMVRVVNNADTDKVMAWQRGFFNFEGASLEEVMKQIERWYDIEVVYADGIPAIEFGGEFTRNMSLSGVLIALEKAGIRYKLEGRRLIVLPE
ncbi:MAG: FecR family protein [Pseudobacter sp.]|uniref:FecR family protein n=1 Tax=Pseudobacter sp. TaxID=2045420 RepID=UPI003F817AC0